MLIMTPSPLLGEPKVMEAVLRNPEPAQYFSLMSSRELAADRVALEKAFVLIKSPPPRLRSGAFNLGDMIDAHLNKKDSIDKHLYLVPPNAVSGVAQRFEAEFDGRRKS